MGGRSKSSGRSGTSSTLSPSIASIGGSDVQRQRVVDVVESFKAISAESAQNIREMLESNIASVNHNLTNYGEGGTFQASTNTISINPSEGFTKHLRDMSPSRFIVSNSQQGYLTHEFVHLLQYDAVRMRGVPIERVAAYNIHKEVARDSVAIIRKAHAQRVDRSQSSMDFKGAVSRYAKTDSVEAIAEAMTDIVLNGSYARRESQLITNAFLDYYK